MPQSQVAINGANAPTGGGFPRISGNRLNFQQERLRRRSLAGGRVPAFVFVKCEAGHTGSPSLALWLAWRAFQGQDETMKTRRMAYWWFRFVLSGRFFEKFFNLRRTSRS